MTSYPNGLPQTKTVYDAVGDPNVIEYRYDGFGRLSYTWYPGSDGSVEYAYDGLGRRTGVTDNRSASDPDDNIGGDGKIAFTYDPLGRLVEVANQDDYLINYTWRADNQRASVTVTEPATRGADTIYHLTYTYDPAGRLVTISEPIATPSPIATFAYDRNGNRDGLSYHLDAEHQAEIEYAYNRDNRLTGFAAAHNAAGNLDTFNLTSATIDGLGRLISAAETLTDTVGNTISYSHSYGYDRLSQLTAAQITNIGGQTWMGVYDYHKDGNLDERTIKSSLNITTY